MSYIALLKVVLNTITLTPNKYDIVKYTLLLGEQINIQNV